MNDAPTLPAPPPARAPRRLWCILGGVAVALLLVLASVAVWIAHHVEPEARRLVVKQLSERLHCRVKLDQLHVSAIDFKNGGWGGLEVTGGGLKIESIDGTGHLAASGVPMLTVAGFAFRTSFRTLLFDAPGAIDVYVQNVILTIPPTPDDPSLQVLRPSEIPGIFLLNRLIVSGAKLIFESPDKGGSPQEFDLREMTLDDLGERKAFRYSAVLLEPAPVNEVRAAGHLGPWLVSSPRNTPIDGEFSFDHADLSAIEGLHGIMSSKGSFNGTLSRLTAQTAEEIPDFALATSAHPFAVRVICHPVLDNTTGNATFEGTTAEFLNTKIVSTGTVTHTAAGHTVEADQTIQGRVEDVLVLLSKTKLPVLKGALEFHGHLTVPAGEQSTVTKSHLQGRAIVRGATWGARDLQQMVDAVSQRAQGKAEVAKGDPGKVPLAIASMTTDVAIDRGTMGLTRLVYSMPGASIVMQGSYPLVGTQIELHGVARTAAKASQLTTGWKSLLLKPVDPLFRKHGAGAELPVKLTGDLSHPAFGTDFKNRGEDKRKTEHVATKQSR